MAVGRLNDQIVTIYSKDRHRIQTLYKDLDLVYTNLIFSLFLVEYFYNFLFMFLFDKLLFNLRLKVRQNLCIYVVS